MKIPIYQIDAFTNEQFKGNPAAVCPLEEWIANDLCKRFPWRTIYLRLLFCKEGT